MRCESFGKWEIWKDIEVILACFKVLPWYFSGGIKDDSHIFVEAKSRTVYVPYTMYKCYILHTGVT
jgi:hypothetical protein